MRLEARRLGFHYPGRGWLFRNVEFAVEAGEIVGLFGASGSGKTTLGRLLAGYLTPREGEILLNGQPLPDKGAHPVQMVHQHPERAVNPRWKIRRTLDEGAALDPALLEKLGIAGDWLGRWPNELSGGQLQRVCIARALGPATRFLIADEMTAMLDAVSQAQIWHAVLREAETRNLGLVVISHDPRLLRRICHRIVRWEEIGFGEPDIVIK